jgi:hypothetical protein
VERGLPLTAVEARFVFARLDAQPGPLPGFTDALVGMRNQYTYSPTERYEHIYLNDNFYAWQCLDGVEKGWRMSIAATMCRWRRISICSSGGRKSFPRWG